MEIKLRGAVAADYPAVITLTNRAYRTSSGQAAWKVEKLVGGQRIDAELLADDLAAPGAELLIAEDESGVRVGHVRLDAGEGGVWFLAMLTVDPDRQDGGLGRQVLEAAEVYARAKGCRRMEMTVITLRTELIAWYERRGYRKTDRIKPFPYGDPRFGEPTRDDIVFVVMEKEL